MIPIASPENVTADWKPSLYTSQIQDPETGDLLLHNSFMGAIARIPADQAQLLKPYFERGFDEAELARPALRELSTQGFFVPSHRDERTFVSQILDREREYGFHIIILPHENCNFRCVYCYETFARGKMNPGIVRGLKTFIDRKVQEIPSLAVSWFGGEPLLARDVIYDLSDSFMASAEKHRVSYASNMTTNGWFMTPDVVDKLIAREVRFYQITIDGPEESHNQTRHLAGGGPTYRRILDNLIAMRRRPDKFTVRIRVNFNNTNVPKIEQFLTELAPLYKDDSRFNLSFHPVGRWGGPNDSTLDVCEAESANAVKHALMTKALNRGAHGDMVTEHLQPHGNVCYAAKETSICVGSDGMVYKCTVAFEDERNHVGRITEGGDFLVNEKRWNLWTKLDDKDTGKCGGCAFNPACESRSCPLVAMDDKEPPCPMTPSDYEGLVRLAVVSMS